MPMSHLDDMIFTICAKKLYRAKCYEKKCVTLHPIFKVLVCKISET